MFELIAMSILGIGYVMASSKEKSEEKEQREHDRIQDLKIKVFRYAVLNRRSYALVVKDLQDGKLTFDQIDEYLERI